MGKGSKARPISVDGNEFADNWDRIFNKSAVDDAADVMSGVDPVIENFPPEHFFNGSNFELAGDFMTAFGQEVLTCLLYTSPSPRDGLLSRMPSSA